MKPISAATRRAIERELRELERRRGDLDRAIARLRRISAWFAQRDERPPVARPRTAVPYSLTDGCRAALRVNRPNGLTPREVKQVLTQSGLMWERFSNPMSAVHTVLKRLVQQHEAIATVGPDGRRRYAAKSTAVVALTRADINDEAFTKQLLQARSPDAVVDLVKRRRG